MPRKAVGTIEWIPPSEAGERGHYAYRISLADGGRPWIHEPPGPKSPAAERTVRERAAARSEQARAEGLTSEDFGLVRRGPLKPAVLTPPKGETSDAWFKRFNTWQIEQGKTSARDSRYAWNTWVSPKLGPKPMASVTRSDIEDVRDALDLAIDAWKREGKGSGRISGKSGMNIWSVLTSAFKAATSSKRRELRILDGAVNPCVGVEPPGDRESRKPRRKTFLYPREASALFACEAVPMPWRELHAVAAMTYLRPGELRVLTWGAVDADAGIISVTEAWDYADAKTKAPKTRNGIRSVPIAPALAPLLARMRGEDREPTDLVVPLLASLNEDVLAKITREHLAAAKVTRADLFPLATSRTHVAVNFRSWRDSGITWLAMTGLGVDKIMRRAGHDTVQTTMGYVKLAEDLGGQLGEPFGPLPESLVTGVSSGESSSEDLSSTISDTYECEGRDLNPYRSYPAGT